MECYASAGRFNSSAGGCTSPYRKGGKTRVVDMPQYFMEYPAVEVELPWGGPEPERETKKFWNPALAAAGVIPMRKKDERWKVSHKDGFHVLRHTYALGHSSPTITLDYYAHFMPEAGGKGAAPSTLLSVPISAPSPASGTWLPQVNAGDRGRPPA
ncbi:hypothetical protein ACRAWF_30170 [Streptomyces sp. L7]